MNVHILWILLFSTTVFGQQYHFNHHEISTDLVRSNPSVVYRHKTDFVFIASSEGLLKYDGIKHKVILRNDSGSNKVRSLFQDNHTLWIGYEDGAIYTYVNDMLTPWVIPEGWPNAPITSILRDISGLIWIATYGEGLYIYDNKTLYNIDADDGLLSTDIYTMVAMKDGRIFVGTDAGIQECGFKNNQKLILSPAFSSALKNDIITVLQSTHDGSKLYVGTYEHGLWLADLRTNHLIQTPLSNQNITDIQLLLDDEMIIQTDNKQQLFHYNTNQNIVSGISTSGLESDLSIIDIFVDVEASIWILCRNNGLVSASANFIKFYTGIKDIQTIQSIKA
ncbi:MAG: hypothetical protein IPO92_00315 [Saprospiraceae bacterium]|nr:hypothetical protein [Saprospiraceae bacterium]